MKKINRFLSCSLAVLSILFIGVGCSKDDPIPDDENTDEVVEYEITKTGSIADYSTFLKSKTSGDEIYYAIVMSLPSIVELVNTKFIIKDKPLRTIRYNYKSIDPQGNEVTESAYMAVPEQAFSGTPAKGIFLYNHGSYTCNASCGTNQDIFETIVAWTNYIFVAPDYYGFGVTSEHPQAYLNPAVAARSSLDAYKAAVQILKDLNVSYDSKVFNGGYSQGGFNSIVNEKYLAEHPKENITFTKTFAGGGSYDVPGTYDEFLRGSYPAGTIFAISSIVAMNECENLGIPYSSLLKGDVLENYQDWFLSKKYTNPQITKKMGSTKISDHLADDIIAKQGDAFNKIWNTCKSYSLVTGTWAPKADSNISVYHLTTDDCVPYTNMGALKNHIDSVTSTGAKVTYTDLDDVTIPDELQTLIVTARKYYNIAAHLCGAFIFFYDIINNEL